LKALKAPFYAGGGLIVLSLNIYGFLLLYNRPGLPANIDISEVVWIEDTRVETPRDVNFALRKKLAGQEATVHLYRPSGRIEVVEAKLARYYAGMPFPLIYFFVGLFSFVMGAGVLLFRPEDGRSPIFYWLALLFSSSLIISGEFYCLRASWLSFLPGLLYLASYPLVFALILHFSMTFFRKKIGWEKLIIYSPAIIFIVLSEFCFLYSVLKPSLETYKFYQSHFSIFRIYGILMILLSVSILILCSRRSQSAAEKAQIAWILYGLFLGVMPFLIFYQAPEILRMKPLLSEEASGVFFVFVPLSFAISILKFKLFDIHLIIHRSLVYTLLTISTVSIYLFIVQVVQHLFSRLIPVQRTAVSVIGVLAAAAAFHPGREKIQKIVDKTFFRLSYDYKKRLLGFTEEARRIFSREDLVDLLFRTIGSTLPVEKIGISVLPLSKNGDASWLGKMQRGEEIENLLHLPEGDFAGPYLWAETKSVQAEEGLDFSQDQFLKEQGWALLFLLPLKSTDWGGLLALGKKRSGEKFTREDMEFLRTLVGTFTLNLERIKLQEEVVYERASREKLAELNRLKTEFISTVSHELRTPLSSLQGLAEILHSGKVRDAKKRGEMLNLMEEESRRLSRLLHNILDFGRIEQNAKSYCLKRTHLQPLVEETAQIFSYCLKAEGFQFRLKMPEKPVYLEADPDALKQALINLLDNAIKYSREEKEVSLVVQEGEKEVQIQIRDKGLGIPAGEDEKIFDKFYRLPEASRVNPEGVGLGLKIVKHIMAAHGGQIKVESEVNQGSTFILVFPRP